MPLPAASTPIRRGTVVRNRTMARLSQPGTNSGGPPSRASAWRATSAGGIRPASWCLSMPWSVGASVSVAPGARTSTSTPWLRSSAHRASPSVITKAFVAAYAADHGKPMNPSIEPVSSSPPRPRANAAPMPDDAPVTSAHGPKRCRKSISASRRDPLEDELAEQRLVHLLRRGGARQRRQEAYVARLLVAGELLAHVRDHVLGGE